MKNNNSKNVDFSKHLYRLDTTHWRMECQELENIICQGEHQYEIKKSKDGWWDLIYYYTASLKGIIKPTWLESFHTEEEAYSAFLQHIYENEYLDSEWSYQWFDSPEEAIEDYMEIAENITIEEVKKKISKTEANIQKDIELYTKKLTIAMDKAYISFKENGFVNKEEAKVAKKILYGFYRHSTFFDICIDHDKLLSSETIAKAKTVSDNIVKD